MSHSNRKQEKQRKRAKWVAKQNRIKRNATRNVSGKITKLLAMRRPLPKERVS